MTVIDAWIEQLAQRGPIAFRHLPERERHWRGRYVLMVVSMGASPVFAWANAMQDDPNRESESVVIATDDARIIQEIEAAGIRIDDLFVD